MRWELDDLYKYARKLSEVIATIPDVEFDCIHDVESWQGIISTKFENDISEIETKITNMQLDYEKIKYSDKNEAAKLNSNLSKLNKLYNLFYRLQLSEVEKNRKRLI